jgi:hypothetical protein
LRIKFSTADLGDTRWYEYAIRFAFGGTITVVTGLIAKHYGPAIGGLFLAFPAIFPATATLIENEYIRDAKKSGRDGTREGRALAGVDAVGTAFGTLGLASFGFCIWWLMPRTSALVALAVATLAWIVTAYFIWQFRDSVWKRFRARFIHGKRMRSPADTDTDTDTEPGAKLN